MQRTVMKKLEQWLHSQNRKPLLLQGARQVGKTYLLKEFGERYFDNTHVLNFEDPSLHSIFEDGPVDIEAALLRIQILIGQSIDSSRDLIFFDEIQDYPIAIHALKYFAEKKPELAIVCAGSHIGISGSHIPFPVGKVHFETLHPLTFEEFLQEYQPLLAEAMIKATSLLELDNFTHEHLWRTYLVYMSVGGMPEACMAFLNNELYEGLSSARTIQKSLITGYINDFAKYCDKGMSQRIASVFTSIPGQLQSVHDKPTNRYQFKGVISKNTKYAHLQDAIDWLVTSGLIIKVPFVNKPETPLVAYSKPNLFKLFLFDIGILNAMLDIDFGIIIGQKQGTYKGFIAENFVAQQLNCEYNNRLYSWSKGRSEIEFILRSNEAIVPIEVKSGTRTRAKSLAEFKKKYCPTLAIKLSGKNLKAESSQLNLPIYMAQHLTQLMGTFKCE